MGSWNNPEELFPNFLSNNGFLKKLCYSFCPATKFIGFSLNFFIFLKFSESSNEPGKDQQEGEGGEPKGPYNPQCR